MCASRGHDGDLSTRPTNDLREFRCHSEIIHIKNSWFQWQSGEMIYIFSHVCVCACVMLDCATDMRTPPQVLTRAHIVPGEQSIMGVRITVHANLTSGTQSAYKASTRTYICAYIFVHTYLCHHLNLRAVHWLCIAALTFALAVVFVAFLRFFLNIIYLWIDVSDAYSISA